MQFYEPFTYILSVAFRSNILNLFILTIKETNTVLKKYRNFQMYSNSVHEYSSNDVSIEPLKIPRNKVICVLL
jgi:hypothetical protein